MNTQNYWAPRPIPPGGHSLPPLPYPYNALEPVISSNTLRIHHDRHHQSYVDGLNNAELKLVEARQNEDFALIKHWERELAFHDSGHILHSIYWTVMTPQGTSGPCIETWRQIHGYFGSMDAFRQQFIEAAINVEASGWAVVIWSPSWNHLEILTAEKHQNLTQWGGIPIMVLDVWEHSYYLDYQNRRADYVKAWWQLINWPEVERRLLLAMRTQVPLVISNLGVTVDC
ncbi:MAG: superoxide dismutase [Firmicutes bacterium]|nr:superoxide dismutase [Bacillota bacterium]